MAAARTTRLTDSGDWREKIVLTAHRYMLEDVRTGLSFLISVGDLAGVPTPLAHAFLSIGGAVVGEDFMVTGRTLKGMGLGDLDKAGLQEAARRGFQVMRDTIACLGAGRMGRGIAVVFSYAGHPVKLVDFKARSAEDFRKLEAEALAEIRGVLVNLATFGMFDPAKVETIRRSRQRRAGKRGASCVLLRCRDLRRRAGSARPQARGAGARLEARGSETDHRLHHLDHPGR